jgi:hypothetical protein
MIVDNELACAFVVRTQGRWTTSDAEALRTRLARGGAVGEGTALEEVLERARTWFSEGRAHLFVCGGRPCRERARDFPGVAARLGSFPVVGHLKASVTECQGPCKQAPIATLRIGERCAMFAQVHNLCDWEAVLDYANRATNAGTLLVDPAGAQAFVFDPVHEPHRGSVALQRLSFLVGHFRGNGRYAHRDGTFHKEVIGTWKAGGRFIGVRMAVTYPLADGRHDVHQALVLVGYEAGAGVYEARAYTDSGTTRDYTLALDGDRVVFSDRVPGHGVSAARARKILMPRAEGYDEVLEIQPESEPFRPYSVVELRTATEHPS